MPSCHPLTPLVSKYGRFTRPWYNSYFDWNDAKTDTVRQLADKFLQRFPSIATQGQGRDWEYAGWYVEMLGYAEHGIFPIAYADWYGEPGRGVLQTTDSRVVLPLPPGGDAEPLIDEDVDQPLE